MACAADSRFAASRAPPSPIAKLLRERESLLAARCPRDPDDPGTGPVDEYQHPQV